MANEIQKESVPTIPSAGAPITQVNQYGDRSVHANHVENLNVTVIENQGSPTEDENGVPFVPLTPNRYDSTTRIIYLGTEEVKLPVQLTPQSSISPQELPYVNALCEVYAERINGVVSPDTIGSLPNALRRNFAEQRKALTEQSVIHKIGSPCTNRRYRNKVYKEHNHGKYWKSKPTICYDFINFIRRSKSAHVFFVVNAL